MDSLVGQIIPSLDKQIQDHKIIENIFPDNYLLLGMQSKKRRIGQRKLEYFY